MTKSKSTLLFLASLLTLVGCNGEGNSSLDSTSSSSSSSTPTVKKIRDIYDVIEGLDSYEFAINFTESERDYTYNFYGDSACSIEYTSSSKSAFTGVIDTKNDGVWTVKQTDDGYSLDQCVSMGNVYSTIAATCFDADIYSYVDVITEDEDAIKWMDDASDDYAGLVYSKVITEGSATTLEVSNEISLVYMSSDYMTAKQGEEYGEYYVNGYFCIEMSVVTASIPESDDYNTINGYLNGFIPVPKFSFDTTALKSISFVDYTEMYNLYMSYMGYSSYMVTAYYIIEGKFDTEANAVTNLNSWISSLLSSSFTIYSKYTTNADGKLKTTGDKSEFIKNSSIDVSISMTGEDTDSTSSTVNPSGDFSITIIIL